MSAYEDDILQWSERQGALLRRIAAGEQINDQVDWENVAEEVESVGRHEFRATESLLIQALSHMLKAEAWPDAPYAARWRLDAEQFRWQAQQAFSPSMRQRIDLERLYRRALRWLPPDIDGKPPLSLPQTCPVTLDELLAED
jgi:Domain of unknown function DUF29